MWIHSYTREYRILRDSEYIMSVDDPILAKIFGIKPVDMAVDGFKTWRSCYVKETFDENIRKPMFKGITTFEIWKKYKKAFYNAAEKLNKLAEEVKNTEVSGLSDKELTRLVEMLKKTFMHYYGLGIMVIFYMDKLVTDKQFLKEKFPGLTEKEFSIMFKPTKSAAHFYEEHALGKLDLNDEKAVKNHIEKYGWIPCIEPNDAAWTKEDLELRKKHLHGKDYDFEKTKNDFEALLQKLPEKQKQLATIINEIVYIKDYRDDVRFKATYDTAKVYKETAKRNNITIDDILFLTDDEIIAMLKKEMTDFKEKIDERKKGYILLKENDTIRVITGEEANKLVNEIAPEEKIPDSVTEIKGIPAMKGKVTGKVVLIKSNADLKRVDESSVLVACFTRPHYLMAMSRSKAIVTDDGGLTSHAAIVSREFNIPCVVGTKNVTKFVKDGEMIEVDADSGIVRKVE